MMSAAEIEPLHLRQIRTEFLLECAECRNEIIGILLAEGMEVQSLNTFQQLGAEIRLCHPEPRAGCAGIIDCVVALR